MTWLQIVLALVRVTAGLVDMLRDRQLIEAGEARAIAEGLRVSDDRVSKAIEARKRVRDGGDDIDPDDPNLRAG